MNRIVTFLKNRGQISIDRVPFKEIYKYGIGFNIEGANLAKHLTQNQKFMIMTIGLDNPIKDGKTLKEITQENPYSLKEMSILEYNECKVNLTLLLIIDYFQEQGKNESLLIQVHRESSGIIFIEILTQIIKLFYGNSVNEINGEFEFSNGFKLKLINGYKENTIGPHPNYKTIFALGWMGILNPTYKSSIISFPSKILPFDTENKIINYLGVGIIDNYLIKIFDKILNVEQEIFFPVIDKFLSQNLAKKFRANTIDESSFHYNTTILQIDKLYNPLKSDLDDDVTIIYPYKASL